MVRRTSVVLLAGFVGGALGVQALAAENGPIVITEIMYNPHDTDEGQEWVEIYNPSTATVNMAGWYLENGHGATTVFPIGTSIAPGTVAVIAPRRGGVSGNGTQRRSTYTNTQTSWNTAWGAGIHVIFVESFWDYPADPIPITGTLGGLSNSPDGASDSIQLRDASNRLIDEVAYRDDEGDETPWPDDDDSGSIQLLRNFVGSVSDNNNGAAWRLSEPSDAMGSTHANTALPAFPGINSYGTPGRLPNLTTTDCNGNGINDAVDIVRRTVTDAYPYNNIPDSCEGDCNANLLPDLTEILLDWRKDRNRNRQLDSCEINSHGGVAGVGGSFDTNSNGILDSFENKPNVVITEIMYDPSGSDEGKEFVEIFNAGASPVDVSGWKLQDIEGDSATGSIPAGTIMQPGEAIVLTAGDGPGVPADVGTQFRAAWNLPTSVRSFALTPWQDRAQRATAIEEVLALEDASGEPVDVANYENPNAMTGSTWPATDAASSIYLLSTAIGKGVNDTGANWRMSIANIDGAYDSVQTPWFTDIRATGSTGSPGIVWRSTPQTSTGQAVITEIMYNPNSSSGLGSRNEWIEVYNPAAGDLDVSGWYLRDEDGRTAPVPAGTTLPAGQVMILIPKGTAADTATAEADFRVAWGNICRVVALAGWSDQEPLPNMGNLSNSPAPGKEVLTLRRADHAVVDIVNYDDDGVVWPTDAAAASPGLGTAWSIYLTAGHLSAADNDIGANWSASLQGIDLADLNLRTAVFNGFDIASPGLLPGIVTVRECPANGCIGDFNLDGGVDGADVEAFFLAWTAGDNVADLNQDGGVDGGDVEFFFVAWSQGC
ncbi:MAG: lamin tail domain-containing protein [Planctomycetes bacterium]|nr:lamin tail domain-containing protein [Planctomycetota bacterium]